jgi:hypothetical protein
MTDKNQRDKKYHERMVAKQRAMKPDDETEFMQYVQLHERVWGVRKYKGKPSLSKILASPIVIFWKQEHSDGAIYTVTLHEKYEDIEMLLFKMLFRQGVAEPRKRPVRMFKNQKRFIVTGVRMDFKEVE